MLVAETVPYRGVRTQSRCTAACTDGGTIRWTHPDGSDTGFLRVAESPE